MIYRVRERHYLDEESFDWEDDVNLELIDDTGQAEWTLPRVAARFRLLDRIQYEHANVNELVEDILGDSGDR